MKNILFSILILLTTQVQGAPHPGTTSSLLTDPEKGNSFIAYGFKLSLEDNPWRPVQKESEGVFAEIQFVHKKKADDEAQISMRFDKLSRAQNIETYAKTWMRDYPQYGFQVLGTKTFSHSGGQGLVVDLLHKENNKQTRQVILLKDQQAAVLTCSHEKPHFKELLPQCNQIVKEFHWLGSQN